MSWLLIPLAVWLVWVGLLWLGQRRLVYPRHLLNPAASTGPTVPGAERLELPAPEGARDGVDPVDRVGHVDHVAHVEAWYIPAAVSASSASSVSGAAPGEGAPDEDAPGEGARGAPAVIFAHGNAELARDWVGAYRLLAEEGVAVLLVEYPGYGSAPGSPSMGSIRAAMVAGWDHLASRPEVDGERIVGLGRSLGGGAVTVLARERPLAALILQSSFTDVGAFAVRMLVPPSLVRDRFDNLSFVRSYEGPVLVFHGREDEVVPYNHGRALADAAERGRLVTWECGHNDCPTDWAAYVEELASFLREEGIL